MSVWSKAQLGWVNPVVVSSDRNSVQLKPIEKFPDALRIDVSTDLYYLVEYRNRYEFDDSLTGPGVLVWRINDAVVRPGLQNNRVNADPNNPGVYLVQADGKRDLDTRQNRGDQGDPFPGIEGKVNLDNTTSPATTGKAALCHINTLSLVADQATFDFSTSGSCAPGGRIVPF